MNIDTVKKMTLRLTFRSVVTGKTKIRQISYQNVRFCEYEHYAEMARQEVKAPRRNYRLERINGIVKLN